MAGGNERDGRLVEAGLALSSELSLPAILQRIVDLATELCGARYGALGVLGPDDTITEFVTAGVSADERAAIGHLPVGLGILEGGMILEVDDDGRGFDPAQATGAGQGLRNLHERALALGGRAEVVSVVQPSQAPDPGPPESPVRRPRRPARGRGWW